MNVIFKIYNGPTIIPCSRGGGLSVGDKVGVIREYNHTTHVRASDNRVTYTVDPAYLVNIRNFTLLEKLILFGKEKLDHES